MTFALAGNQNCGKTTLFNTLTGSSRRVGNFPGVTVEKVSGIVSEKRFDVKNITAVDLPGVYSLTPFSDEERAAADYLKETPPDTVIAVADSTCLSRALFLVLRLRDTGLPTVLALNMTDRLRAGGGSVNEKKLARLLGMPVVSICAADGSGCGFLIKTAEKTARLAKSRPAESEISEQAIVERYKVIDGILRECYKPPDESRKRCSRTADRVLCGRVTALPCFALITGLVFYLTFSLIGSRLSTVLAGLFSRFSVQLRQCLPALGAGDGVTALVSDGIAGGVGTVLSFLPVIIILFFMLSLLEDSGYMARVAYIFDRPMRALGLSGRDAVTLLMGFGCSVPAVMAARTSTCEKSRRRTVFLIPFMSCSAKIPVFSLLANTFFPGKTALIIAGLYLTGVVFGLLCLLPSGRGKPAPYMLELPDYRMPRAKNLFRSIAERAGDFIKRAFTVVFIASLVCWAMSYFTFGLRPAGDGGKSMLCVIGNFAAPLFEPAGFGDGRAAASLLAGIFAKEAVVSTLAVSLGETGLASVFTPRSAMSFMIFVLLYPPCVAAFGTAKRELRSLARLLMHTGIRLVVAYISAVAVYRL